MRFRKYGDTSWSVTHSTLLFGDPDSFDRANSAVSLGDADSGQTWTAHAGTWGISGNAAYQPSATAGGRATVESGVADGTVEVTVATAGGSSGVVLRLSDASNYVRAFFSSTDSIFLQKVVAGSATTIASGAVTHANGDVLRAVMSGSNYTIYQNGDEVLTGSDAFNSNFADTLNRVTVVADADGNRTSVTFNFS